jgi:hypothetical protein
MRRCPFADCERYRNPVRFACEFHRARMGKELSSMGDDLVCALHLGLIVPHQYTVREFQLVARAMGCPFDPDYPAWMDIMPTQG